MTGTPFCMLPVTSMNEVPIGTGKVGPIFRKLITKWSNNTNIDIVQQIKKWNEVDSKINFSAPTPYSFKKS